MSSVASAQNFATRNGITTQPTPGEVPQDVSDDSTSVESLTWHANGTPLYCLCTVRGGGLRARYRRMFQMTALRLKV